MLSAPPVASVAVRRALWLVVGIHIALLLAMIPDYLADNDLGFHISLARQYAEHGTYFWDDLNWAPAGRPNLQGPLLHICVGALGRLFGGEGNNYVLAFSLFAVFQWASAVFTAVFFARRYSGDLAALIAAAVLTGGIWSSAPFFVGVPSGWIFILTPWAIHFFLQDRYIVAALFTSAVMYVHLGGAPVAPFGVLLAAAFTRRWKGLLITGALTALITSPYLFHFFRHLDYYRGQRGHVAGEANVLAYLLAVPGLVLLFRRPKQNLFILVWAFAPLAWVFQDGLRFMLQSTIAASVIGGIFVAWALDRVSWPRLRAALAAALVALATLFPFSIPSLPVEWMWASGHGFPRELDWDEARALASVVERDNLRDRIVNSYYDSLSAAMSVYLPLHQEFGHWGEVRPPVNPARDISAARKLYVLPLPPTDEVLGRLGESGWINVHGGSLRSSIVTLRAQAAPGELDSLVELIIGECRWLAASAVNNRFPPPSDLFRPANIERLRQVTTVQRDHAGRIAAATLIYAYALEASDKEAALGARGAVRGWGSVANFIGDETALDYLSDARFELFRDNLTAYANALAEARREGRSIVSTRELLTRLFDDFFG